jgi:type I restriction enzyme, S subunit
MNWKKVKLGEVIRHRKGFITISDDENYKLCRVQLHRKGVVLRQIVRGSAITTKKQQVCRANDFIVAEMDAKVGGYGFIPESLDGAIVSSHYYLFEVNEKLLMRDFLDVLNKKEVLQNQIKATGSTNYASVRPADVLGWIIPLPSIAEQEKIIEQYFEVEKNSNQLKSELSRQLDLVKKLRQQILQDAVQGKLVSQDADDEPAGILLEKIKAEKAQLLKEKKVKKRQALIADQSRRNSL